MNLDKEYHQRRSGLRYYAQVRRVLDLLSPAESIADIGGGPMTVADGGSFERRTLIDRRAVDAATLPPDVDAIVSEWLDVPEDWKWSIITCLQVVEHQETYELAARFVRKLLRHSEVAIVSVPWRWKPSPGHPQDPMDLSRLIALADREPEQSMIVREVCGPARLVAVFTESPEMRERLTAGLDTPAQS